MIAEKDPETGAAMAERLQEKGARALFVEMDVSARRDAETAVAQALGAFGRLDSLVNNAGINVFHEPLETSEAEWRRCFAVDLDGVWHMCRAALPGMLEQGGGSIVNIASSHSSRIIPRHFPLSGRQARPAWPDPFAWHRIRGARCAGERHCAGLYRYRDCARLLGRPSRTPPPNGRGPRRSIRRSASAGRRRSP